MLRTVWFASFLIGTLLVAHFASAETATKAAMPPGMMMVCHAPKGGEKANAIMSSGKMPMVCKSVVVKKMLDGPDMPAVKNTEAFKAWQGFISTQLGMQ